MASTDGRFTIAFNGEIYNYAALRAGLLAEGHPLRSNSDTETVLELYAQEGAQCLHKLEGMFALAIWDEADQSLFLARDPLGIKPLYYQAKNGFLIFASELRALLESGLVERRLSAAGVNGYLMTGSVPEPETIVQDVNMLPAGHFLRWQAGKAVLTKYWEVDFRNVDRGRRSAQVGEERRETKNVAQSGTRPPIITKYREAVTMVRQALDDSIDRHLVSDVPVGVFLSGGIDSTAIVALAVGKTKEPLRTFSISFDDPTLNEGSAAAKTAAHFGTLHSDWRLDSTTARELLKEFLERSDQPSVDGFNTFCVSKLAHDQGLKVVLSGLGGDEVFGGYSSFRRVPQLLKASRKLHLPAPLRRSLGRLLEFPSSPRVRRLGGFLRGPLRIETAYECMRGIFTENEAQRLLRRYVGVNSEILPFGSQAEQPSLEDEVSYLELTRYMRNQLLRDSDVMSMAWGLELRVPLVDRKLIDSVSQFPARWRLARGKQMLLDAVPEIPEWIRNRPKQGFAFPFRDWVMSEWDDLFQRLEKQSPVPLQNWYRTWCLLALENFIACNGVEGADRVGAGYDALQEPRTKVG